MARRNLKIAGPQAEMEPVVDFIKKEVVDDADVSSVRVTSAKKKHLRNGLLH